MIPLFSLPIKKKGSILSNDKDMFRYDSKLVPVYMDFRIAKDRLILLRHKNDPNSPNYRPSPSPSSKRILESSSLPEVSENSLDFSLLLKHKKFKYLRGSPSPLTRLLGNLHLTIRPLRQAAYHRTFLKHSKTNVEELLVQEIFPVWDEKSRRATWSIENVKPSNQLDYLLDDPKAAFDFFFANAKKPTNVYSDNKWLSHYFAMHAVVYEVIVGCGGQMNLLDLMKKYLPSAFSKQNRK